MKKIKTTVRILLFIILLLLACAGVGMFNYFPVQRDRYENEVRTEQVERKKQDDEEASLKEVE